LIFSSAFICFFEYFRDFIQLIRYFQKIFYYAIDYFHTPLYYDFLSLAAGAFAIISAAIFDRHRHFITPLADYLIFFDYASFR